MGCADLREISQSFLCESSRLRIFVRGVNAKKELFFLGRSVYVNDLPGAVSPILITPGYPWTPIFSYPYIK